MLVVLNNEQVFQAHRVCQGCLLANQEGLPRWQGNHLCCAAPIKTALSGPETLYECQMGFRLAQIEG
ncbi:hypothetical protein [Synechocystis sp. LKSZ1]|uniref:hypothetical protein n=1 Tax=Synechocystis sp. LKSZ1 TaxID=3144951 RepID=UPI00336BFAFE